jgi:hypothetical protein
MAAAIDEHTPRLVPPDWLFLRDARALLLAEYHQSPDFVERWLYKKLTNRQMPARATHGEAWRPWEPLTPPPPTLKDCWEPYAWIRINWEESSVTYYTAETCTAEGRSIRGSRFVFHGIHVPLAEVVKLLPKELQTAVLAKRTARAPATPPTAEAAQTAPRKTRKGSKRRFYKEVLKKLYPPDGQAPPLEELSDEKLLRAVTKKMAEIRGVPLEKVKIDKTTLRRAAGRRPD